MSGLLRLPEQNQVTLTGRLTRDPEVFFTPQGTAKCWFSIAVNQNYKDKASGEWKEQVSYIPVVVWRQAAERCKEKLRKGSPVHIEGRLRSREFEDKKSGGKRTVLEVEARRVQFLERAQAQAQAQVPAEASSDAVDMDEVPF
ncbi:MAG: hypothetical protein A3J74_04965 [Elusimicrobia bacterium RIFCSPHIGHO2_02_FULL_57_9]|nr:MAG: hypothetical protein A3J74_04965 [Elusimicrobia bacterium RIFCSPHIGHO2_02_FULL_57_9]